MDANFDQKLAELKQSHEAGMVVGLKDVAGIAPRLDIDVLLHKEPDTFNLFLIALSELQGESSDKWMGYYQIAGIHGYPSGDWNNIAGRKGFVGDPGYCVHGEESFPTWHRPYLAMLEQALFIKMFEVADKYDEPLRASFREAAFKFRLPYLDYWRPRKGPGNFTFPGVISNGQTAYDYDYSAPAIFTATKVTVRQYPKGKSTLLDPNPLHHFAFKAGTGELTTTEWDNVSRNTTAFPRDRTVRHPTRTSPDNPDRLNSVLNELRMDANRLGVTMVTDAKYGNYHIFSTNSDPEAVSNNPPPRRTDPLAKQIAWGSSGSLEAVHGMYHVFFGGWGVFNRAGHMSQVPCAAFDPIFWGHHGQIERMFSVWQAVHENAANSWLSSSREASGSLLPFLKPESVGNATDEFWTSNLARNCEDFGYTYTDLDKTLTMPVADRFRALYSWSIPLVPGAPKQAPPDSMKPLPVEDSEFFKEPNAAQELQVPMSAKKPNKTVAWDWYVDDRVERLALNTSFTITYFVLQSDEDTIAPAADFALDPALVGVSHVFASPIETCPNCRDQAEKKLVIRNTIPITSQLLDYVVIEQLPSMEPDDVLKFLKRRLRWRIVKADGERVDPRSLDSLQIKVSSKKTRLDEGTGQPAAGVEPEYVEYPEVIDQIKADASAEAGHMAEVPEEAQ